MKSGKVVLNLIGSISTTKITFSDKNNFDEKNFIQRRERFKDKKYLSDKVSLSIGAVQNRFFVCNL